MLSLFFFVIFFLFFCKELTVKCCRDLSQAGMKDVSLVYYVFKN